MLSSERSQLVLSLTLSACPFDDYSPPELKIEPRSPPLVLNENTDITNDVPDIPVNLPRTKRVYVRKPLPPPRERDGTRQAFDVALKTLSGTLKRKKEIYIAST